MSVHIVLCTCFIFAHFKRIQLQNNIHNYTCILALNASADM